MNIIDISLPITPQTPVWPGQPNVEISPLSTFEEKGSRVSRISLTSHTGTHIDAPSHFLKDGGGVEMIPLERLIGPCRILDLTHVTGQIVKADLEMHSIKSGERILFKTINSKHLLQSEFYNDYISLSPDGADYLIEKNITLVGIDYLGIEKRGSVGHPVHTKLLSNNIVIVEGLYLEKAELGEYQLYCLPLNLPNLDGAPARAILVSNNS